jgi:transcriptional regulator with XRE-family HTH domain
MQTEIRIDPTPSLSRVGQVLPSAEGTPVLHRVGLPAVILALALSPTSAAAPVLVREPESHTSFVSSRMDYDLDMHYLLRWGGMRAPLGDPEGNQTGSRIAEGAASNLPAAAVLESVADLGEWLGITEQQVAEMAGFTRRNISKWRAGAGAYPKTTRQLNEIHAFVAALRDGLGEDGARAWVAGATSDGARRRDSLETEAGRSALYREARSLLFRAAPPRATAARWDESDEDFADTARAAQTTESIVRPRRLS